MLEYAMQLHSQQKQTNLKLKTWPKQLLGSLPLTFVLPDITYVQKPERGAKKLTGENL